MGLLEICQRAKTAECELGRIKTTQKNEALCKIAQDLCMHTEEILKENEKDLEQAKAKNMPSGLIDRLCLTKDRIVQMAEGLKQIAGLDDPIGEVLGMKQRPNGLMIGQKRVPLGVVGIIYE